MAYDRDDARREAMRRETMNRGGREPRASFSDERGGSGGSEDRGFFERAGDQIASWFGDEDDEPRRQGRDDGFRRDSQSYGREREREPERGYRPLAGDYGRTDRGARDSMRPQRPLSREEEQQPGRNPRHDPHYAEWRQRQIDALDRDYDEYRREHQSKFENDFGGWREKKQTKRQMLGQIRPQMAVLGSDEQPVGTVDRVAGDRIILAKADADSGGAHHSLPCTMIGSVEGERVLLEATADQAKQQWRDENRDRALFEREDQGETGPHMLDRSFSGTYR